TAAGGGLLVTEVLPDSPAQKAGILPGDTIIAVEGRTFQEDPNVSARIRGAVGTAVRLRLQRPGSGTLEVDAVRAEVSVPALEWRILADGTGYVRVRTFARSYAKLPGGRTSAEELDAALEAFEAAGAKRWVVDLRNNGGGSVATLEEVAGRFLADGLIGV